MPRASDALEYAREGRPVFPLAGKKPLTNDGFKSATTNYDQIYKWWATGEHNIGSPIPEGVIVVDIDPDHGGDKQWEALCAEHGAPPPTRTQWTGSGGAHLWYSCPVGLSWPAKVAGNIGLDFRAGGKSYVVVAPSVHASGKVYAWESRDRPIAQAPNWLLDMAYAREAAKRQESADFDVTERLWTDEQVRQTAECFVGHWHLGQRHSLSKALGGWLRQRGAGAGDLAAVMALLPSDDPDARLSAAADCYSAGRVNGWGELQAILGEAEAERISKHAAYTDVWDVPDAWVRVLPALRQPPAGLTPQPVTLDPTDPYCGLPHPMDPNESVEPLVQIVEGLDIVAGTMTAIVGKPHAGKTPTAFAMALAIAHGVPFVGRETVKTRVIYLTFEKPKAADRKRVRIARAMKVDPRGVELINMTRDLLNQGTTVEKLTALASKAPCVVFVDTYSAAVVGVEHNKAEYAYPLRRLANEVCATGAAVVALLHCRKGDFEPTLDDVEGSGQLAASIEAVIGLHRPDSETRDLIEVLCTRALEDGFEPFRLRWANVQINPDATDPAALIAGAIVPDWGLAVSVDEPEAPEDAPLVAPTRGDQAHDVVCSQILAALAATQGAVSRGHLRGLVDVGESRVSKAIRSLLADGRLIEYRDGKALSYALARGEKTYGV